MRGIAILTLFFSISLSAASNGHLVDFTFTKPHSLLNFVETILDKQGGSQTLKAIFHESKANTPASRAQLEKLSKLKTEYTYRFDGYPDSRFMMRSTWDLLTISAARCETLRDLKVATVGILPNKDHHDLFEGLMYFDTIYSDLIWNDNLTKLAGYCTQLNDYARTRNIDSLFTQLSTFYGSSWDLDVPFKVCLYPIPAKRGNSTATPKGNIVTCGVLLDDYNYANTLSVVFHELCHLLYREQSPELQTKFESWFIEAGTPSRLLAYQLADEGIATALGNGWVYRSLTEKMDTSDWYNDIYINRFAKNSYPLIKDYVERGKTIDKGLIHELCAVYEKVFPEATSDFNNLFSNIHIVADLNDSDAQKVFPAAFRNFRIGGAGFSTPLDQTNLTDLNTHLATRIILVSSDNKKTWDFVKRNVDDIRSVKIPDTEKNFFQLEQSDKGYSYLLINLTSPAEIDKGFDHLKKLGKTDLRTPVFF